MLTATLGSASYELTRVFKDPDAAGAEVILVLRTSGGNGESAVVVRTPQSAYASGLCTPVVDYYPHTIISAEELDPRRTYYTRKGIAAVSHDGLVTLYDFSGNKISSLPLGQRKELRLGFDLEGTHFYCFNLDDRLLYEGETGW